MNSKIAEVQRQLPGCLDRIAVQITPGFPQSFAKCRNVLNDTRFIIGEHHRGET